MDIYIMGVGLYLCVVQSLYEVITGVYEQKTLLAGKAGMDGIFIGEDMGSQTSLSSAQKCSAFTSKRYTAACSAWPTPTA